MNSLHKIYSKDTFVLWSQRLSPDGGNFIGVQPPRWLLKLSGFSSINVRL